VDDGLMLLCQLAVGTKLADDPVARRLFDQMVNYALSYRLEQRPTALVADAGSLKARMLGATSIRFDRVDSPGEALAGDHEILVVDATPGNLAQLAGRIDRVRRFCREGGWIMLWGVTPEGLADFNKLVGVEHLIRPFALEKVEIRVPRDRLMAGVSQRDVVMSTGKKIQAGSANEILADDAFSYVVDYRDVAPFAKFPSPAEMGKPAGNYGPGSDHWPRAMVNGLGREYNWRYTFTFIMQRGDKTEWTVELPREETIEAFAIKPNLNFKHLRKIKLTFDGDESSSVVVDVEPSWNPQRTEFEPRAARRVTFKLLQWDDNTDRELIAIDNLWLYAKRSDEFLRKVKPLLNIGALMRYPMGAGGIVLNQVNPLEAETLPINAQKKKTLVAGLLGNLGAASSSSRTLLPGEGLTYRPISLEGQCNLYLTSEKNWPVSDRDLADLPLDRQKLAGVVYNIRDFKTSPLESAIAVGRARGFKGPKAVEGIEVGGKADVLFFLHTWIEQRSWSPGRRNNVPPTVLEYVVHYADGESQRIPVRYGLGVADWLQGDPQGLRDAALAWTGPARGEGETKTRPSVWQMQWTNPRPDTAIESIDVTLDKETGNRYGLPVVLGITAANVIE
jgi:beta-galactosidase